MILWTQKKVLLGRLANMPGHFTFFAESVENDIAIFGENETKHAVQVLRYAVGFPVEFTMGQGLYYKGKVIEIGKRTFSASIEEVISFEPRDFTLCVGILKSSDRMEWLVEKAVELGVSRLIFMKTQNTERVKVNLEKLNRVAIAALKQCHGAWNMQILDSTFHDCIALESNQKFIAFCNFKIQVIKPVHFEQGSLVLIGPEGDFSEQEVELALAKSFNPISLGSQILRTETAAIACAALAL